MSCGRKLRNHGLPALRLRLHEVLVIALSLPVHAAGISQCLCATRRYSSKTVVESIGWRAAPSARGRKSIGRVLVELLETVVGDRDSAGVFPTRDGRRERAVAVGLRAPVSKIGYLPVDGPALDAVFVDLSPRGLIRKARDVRRVSFE
jgi:hypothetical protein